MCISRKEGRTQSIHRSWQQEEKMSRIVNGQTLLNISAADAWGCYGTLCLANLFILLNPDHKIETEGNGNPGTFIDITFPPGTPYLSFYREVITRVDDEKREKEVKQLEGARLDAFGIALKRSEFAIVEKGEKSCIVKSRAVYEIFKEDADFEAGLAAFAPLFNLVASANDYLNKNTK